MYLVRDYLMSLSQASLLLTVVLVCCFLSFIFYQLSRKITENLLDPFRALLSVIPLIVSLFFFGMATLAFVDFLSKLVETIYQCPNER